jgi:CRP/FNR family transcriptional regulator, cyclic AMP receptor protein
MISTVEKVLFLKGIDLFSDIASEDLAQVAQISQEVQIEKGQTILVEGDIGDALYIILEGEAQVYKGKSVVATLGEREPLGEMGILDSAPRSATVVALTDVSLLKIDREDFHDLMSDRLEIAQGVIKVLLKRLREATGASSGGK